MSHSGTVIFRATVICSSNTPMYRFRFCVFCQYDLLNGCHNIVISPGQLVCTPELQKCIEKHFSFLYWEGSWFPYHKKGAIPLGGYQWSIIFLQCLCFKFLRKALSQRLVLAKSFRFSCPFSTHGSFSRTVIAIYI